MWTDTQWLCYFVLGLDITRAEILVRLRYWCCVHRTRQFLAGVIRTNKELYDLCRVRDRPCPKWKQKQLIYFRNGNGPFISMDRRSINRCKKVRIIHKVSCPYFGWRIRPATVEFFRIHGGNVKEVVTETQFFEDLRDRGILYK